MKNVKYSITFGIALVCAMLFTTCNIPDQPENLRPDESGYGKIRIIFAEEAARTVLPPTVFDRYVYTFTKEGENEVPRTRNPGSDGLFTLEIGSYTVAVQAYTGAAPGTLAATGSSSQFSVDNGVNAGEVIVNLTPVSAGTGTFTYTITYPEGAVPAITLQKWPDMDNITLDPDNLAEGNGITETLTLNAGSYLLTVLVGKDELFAGKNEAVHIYPTLTTVYTRNFTEDNLIDAILPTVNDYNITGMEVTYDGSAKAASITRKVNASPGTITILYNGAGSAPVNAGRYTVTFNIGAAIGFLGTTLQAGTMEIKQANGAAVSAPVVSISGNTITVSPVTPPTNGQTVEYAKSSTSDAPSTGWQSTLTFTGSTGTNYVFARAAGNDNYLAGAASVTTLQSVPSNSIVYYWVNEQDNLVTTDGGVTRIITGQNLVITAQANGYTVEQWHLNGSNISNSGNTYTFSSTLAGKHIVGLFVQKDSRLYNTNITITVENPYIVTFSANGGSGTVPAMPKLPGSTITLPSGSGLSRSGYAFGGWNTQADGNGTNYSAGSSFTPTDTITLYAKWNPTYTITFNINGGSGTIQSMTILQSVSSITLPSGSELSKSGCIFGGWNTAADGTGTNYNVGASYSVSGNATLYARWLDGSEANPFPLTAGVWANGEITSTTSVVWYSFNVTSGTYRIWWNDNFQSDGSKTVDVRVSAYNPSGTNIFFNVDSGWSSPQSFTISSSGTVKIKVDTASSSYRGTFAVVYSTGSTRP
jgi:uncharacterized repeat protein (TIGR02543 family)